MQKFHRKEKRLRTTNYSLPLSSLLQAVCLNSVVNYSCGATYRGHNCDGKRCGVGIFAWPSGETYVGQFANNKRNGKGLQKWTDGSMYCGTFEDDLKHGVGLYRWPNGEVYQGQFFHDHRHGRGDYHWPNGFHFAGTFFMDKKEGYGRFTFTDHATFQGLYRADKRDGPGLYSVDDSDVSTAQDDVGFWSRDHLVKLCVAVPGVFTVAEHWPLSISHPDSQHLAETAVSDHGYRGARATRGDIDCPPPVERSMDARLPVDSLALNRRAFDDAFDAAVDDCSPSWRLHLREICVELSNGGSLDFSVELALIDAGLQSAGAAMVLDAVPVPPQPINQTDPGASSSGDAAMTWSTNLTPSCVRTLQHVARHRRSAVSLQQCAQVAFSVDAVLTGDRRATLQHLDTDSRQRAQGLREMSSELVLRSALEGDLEVVSRLVSSQYVHVDVAERRGNTALHCAAINGYAQFKGHTDVINCLLDNGGDVNKLNDDGVSALVISFFSLYPVSAFTETPRKQSHPTKKGSDRSLKKNVVRAKKKSTAAMRSADTVTPAVKRSPKQQTKSPATIAASAAVEKPPVPAEAAAAAAAAAAAEWVPGQLTVRRLPRTDIDALMLGGVKEMDVIWHSAAEAAEAMRNAGDGPWKVVTVVGALNHATKRFTGKKTRAQQRRLIHQLAAAATGTDDTHDSGPPVTAVDDEQRQTLTAGLRPLDQAIIGAAHQSCRTDLLKHLLSSAPLRPGVTHDTWVKSVNTASLLLARGADPNASIVPVPVLLFAVKNADSETVRQLLLKGAKPDLAASKSMGGLTPLHMAAELNSKEGVQIIKMLLTCLADANIRAVDDGAYLHLNLKISPGTDGGADIDVSHSHGGRTALHIACARTDNHKMALRAVRLLLKHGADTDLLCDGHSPLSLAITSGNDMVVDELLSHGVDVNQSLTHGLGNAMCVATLPVCESNRSPALRIALVNKLVAHGAHVLAPVEVGPQQNIGTIIDYAMYVYSQEQKTVSSTSVHSDRSIAGARHELLTHITSLMQQKILDCEEKLLQTFYSRMSLGQCVNYIHFGASAKPSSSGRTSFSIQPTPPSAGRKKSATKQQRMPMFRICYGCGRSLGVKLTACHKCHAVYFCSAECMKRSASAGHSALCPRVAAAASWQLKRSTGTLSQSSRWTGKGSRLHGTGSHVQTLDVKHQYLTASHSSVRLRRQVSSGPLKITSSYSDV